MKKPRTATTPPWTEDPRTGKVRILRAKTPRLNRKNTAKVIRDCLGSCEIHDPLTGIGIDLCVQTWRDIQYWLDTEGPGHSKKGFWVFKETLDKEDQSS